MKRTTFICYYFRQLCEIRNILQGCHSVNVFAIRVDTMPILPLNSLVQKNVRSDPHQLLILLLLYVAHDGLLWAGALRQPSWSGRPWPSCFRDPRRVWRVRGSWSNFEIFRCPTRCPSYGSGGTSFSLFPKKLSATRFDWTTPLSYNSLVSLIKLTAWSAG